jgi:hypothetical protein
MSQHEGIGSAAGSSTVQGIGVTTVVALDAAQHHVTLEACEIRNGLNGLELAGSDHTLDGVEIHDCTGHGLKATCNNSILKKIRSYENDGSGIVVAGNGNTIDSPHVHDNGEHGIVLGYG